MKRKEPTIVVDSREQRPYFLDDPSIESVVAGLPSGDYSLAGFENVVAIERKSLQDRCETGDVAAGAWTSTEELFGAWKIWCEKECHKNIGTNSTFCRDLIAAVPGLVHKRGTGIARPWGYEGIRVLPLTPTYEGDKLNGVERADSPPPTAQ